MCDHYNARFHITIWHELDCELRVTEIHDDVILKSERPTHVRVEVYCPDCELRRTYNAWAHEPASAARWPQWVIERLIALRAHHEGVHEACAACHVPPATHPAWPLRAPF